MHVWKAQGKPIVIGIALNGQDEVLLASVFTLAQKFQSGVELVHCLEAPWDEEHAKTALEFLRTLTASTPEGTEIHLHIERGDPMDHLCRIAREVSAGLIVCGLRNRVDHRTFRGLSTVLSLAFYAPIPVLILPLGTKIDFRKPVNVMISDSFGENSWQDLNAGLNLAFCLDSPSVTHVHIIKAAAEETAPPEAPLRQIEEELFYRFHNTASAKDLLARYHPWAFEGDLDTGINHIVDETQSRLLIMGRSQFLLKKKLALNSIPYQIVMEGKAGLLILTADESKGTHESAGIDAW